MLSCSRLQPVALNNSFFGSACREWQDQLALGLHGNSTGGRRGDKKPRNCGDWKDKYFESEWGQRQCKVEKSDAIFFPRDHDPPLSHTLSSILSGFNSRRAALSPPPAPPPSRPQQKPVSKPSTSKSVCSVRQRSPHTRHASSAVRSKRDSHNPRNNFRILSPSSRKPVTSRNHLVLSNKNRISSRSSFLSPLPHKMSYTALIDALHKASRNNNTSWALHLYANPANSDVSPLHVQHTNSVFHDHFSTLASPSVPSAFLSSYPLVVSLPLSLHTNLLRQRVVLSDHNYTPLTSDSQPASLPLSLPRSLLPSPPPHTLSSCSSRKLALCSTCNSLYHLNCSHGNLCPSCTRPLS
ncbi:hypothetical protein GBAR_LOCUS24074 [Geodia barretti]|uniref:ASX DEUBAD domain-containing protein n=1 Tax=Geodia barretti TaxID=519541 RepID=A0AA35T7W0_GEOBA|nr:hypothetical protein GBAR_LOCUS24074 [Geodia barretti]